MVSVCISLSFPPFPDQSVIRIVINIVILQSRPTPFVVYPLRIITYPAYKNGQLNVSELARVCDLSRTTVYKYIALLET